MTQMEMRYLYLIYFRCVKQPTIFHQIFIRLFFVCISWRWLQTLFNCQNSWRNGTESMAWFTLFAFVRYVWYIFRCLSLHRCKDTIHLVRRMDTFIGFPLLNRYSVDKMTEKLNKYGRCINVSKSNDFGNFSFVECSMISFKWKQICRKCPNLNSHDAWKKNCCHWRLVILSNKTQNWIKRKIGNLFSTC